MSASLTFTMSLDNPKLSAVLAALGLPAPTGISPGLMLRETIAGQSAVSNTSGSSQTPTAEAIEVAASMTEPEQAPLASASPPPGSAGSMSADLNENTVGLAVIDAAGAAVIADPQHASQKTIAALRLLASRRDVDEHELLAVVGAATLAGNKAALTKRVQAATGTRTGAALYRIKGGKVVVAEATRQSLARHFDLPANGSSNTTSGT